MLKKCSSYVDVLNCLEWNAKLFINVKKLFCLSENFFLLEIGFFKEETTKVGFYFKAT